MIFILKKILVFAIKVVYPVVSLNVNKVEVAMSKLKYTFKLCLFFIIALMIFGCKSTPEETPAEEPIVQEEAVPEPEQKEVLVEEVVVEPVKEDKSSQIAELSSKIEQARKQAIDNGAEYHLSDVLALVDSKADDVLALSKTSSDQDLILLEGQTLLDYYISLDYASRALTIESRIVGFSFQSYDQKNYDAGIDDLNAVQDLYLQGSDSLQIKQKTESSYNAFKTVLDTAFMKLAQGKRGDILKLRTDVDAVKAGAADKSGYNSVMLKFMSAETKLAEKDYEGAYNQYVETHNALIYLYERVLVKRKAAEEAIARVKNKTEAVNSYALEADTIAPLSEQTDTEAAQ